MTTKPKPQPKLVSDDDETGAAPAIAAAPTSEAPPESDRSDSAYEQPSTTDAEPKESNMSDGDKPKLVIDNEELDEDEKEFRAMRRDLPHVAGASAAGIVTIAVAKTPGRNVFFRTHPDFEPVIALVTEDVGMDKQWFAVAPEMEASLRAINIAFADHRLYLTITAKGAIKIIPVRCAEEDGSQNEYNRTKEVGLLEARKGWQRFYTDRENQSYEVFAAPIGRFAEPVWPDLKPAKIVRLSFRDKGRRIDSTEHPLFLAWAGRDGKAG